jgi:hypothetical protein
LFWLVFSIITNRWPPTSLQYKACIVCNSQISWSLTFWLITLVGLQLDAQNSYLFTYNTFIKILYMFRALPCSSSGGLRRNCIYAASGINTVCRWLSCAPVNRCTRQSAYIQLRRRPPEDERGNAQNM